MWFHVYDDSAGVKRQGFERSAEEGSGLVLVWSLSKGFFWRFEDSDGDWTGAEVAWVCLISHFRGFLSLLAETLMGWALFQLVMQIGLGCRLKLVGLVEAKELAMTDWVCCRLRLGMGHSLMIEWLPSLCCLLKGRAGYLAKRVDKAERLQTLLKSSLQGSNRADDQGRHLK